MIKHALFIQQFILTFCYFGHPKIFGSGLTDKKSWEMNKSV
jgi:hypothetical protein